MKSEYIYFAAYLLLGPAMWFAIGFALIKGRKRMSLIGRPAIELPAQPPLATILIPAKDEGIRIRACLESALAQDYPNFEVIAVDDRSRDETGKVMDGIAAADTRMRVVHIRDGELPTGWTGKNNALQTAVSHARGEWLLFVDSDVVLQPDALRTAVAFSVAKRVGLFSLFPSLESHTLWESTIVPLAGATVSMLYLVALTNNDHWPGSFANGQFMMFSRDAYEAIGRHASVKDRFCEDVEFARLVKPTGRRVRVTWGTQFASVRMYDSLASIMKGWARIFYACSVGRPWRIFVGAFFLLASGFSVYPAFVWGLMRPDGQGWVIGSIIHFCAMTSSLALIYGWSGNPRRNALLFPLGGAMLGAIFVKALRMCVTGKLEWRGTQYAKA